MVLFTIMLFVGTAVVAPGTLLLMIKWIGQTSPEEKAASEARRRAEPYEGGCIHHLGSECEECRWGEERRRTEAGYPAVDSYIDGAAAWGDVNPQEESPLGIFG